MIASRIGYTYAKTFPDRIRSIVLDGSVEREQPAGLNFGYVAMNFITGCEGLSFTSTPIPNGQTLPENLPIMIANSIHDPQTPLPWAQAMQQAIPGAPLLTYGGTKHGIWPYIDTACVRKPITNFHLTGDRPDQTLIECPSGQSGRNKTKWHQSSRSLNYSKYLFASI